MARRLVRTGTGSSDNMDIDYDDYEDDEFDDDEGPFEEETLNRARREATQRPSRRRVSREEPAEEERPRRGFRKAAESDEKPSRSRRVRSAAEDDSKPSRGRSAPAKDVLGHGFKSYKTEAAKRSIGYKRLEVPEGGRKRKLIKFLQPEPITHYYEHWVPRANGKKRPYVCLGDVCAICGIGDRAKPVLLWNIVDMDDGLVKVWVLSKDPAKKVEECYDELADSDKTIDDFNSYFAVSKKKGDNNFISYKVEMKKRRDVEEDFDIEPLEEDEIEELLGEAYDDSIVYIPSVAELQAVAEELDD
jgi:hypothetical protein